MTSDSFPKILIVDDEATNRALLNQILSEENILRSASSGVEALEVAASWEPDLILLDVAMEDMDGFETCRQLKANELLRHIPVIFVSALDEMRDETEGLEIGAIDYITKPVWPGIVRARVKNHVELKRSRDILEQLAQYDGLTGIPNRRAFDHQIDIEVRRAKRSESNLSVVLIDIDHFKQYNDSCGHVQGDDCLKAVAQALKDSLVRAGDFVARYGGEEFVCLLPNIDSYTATHTAERLRNAVEKLGIVHEHSSAGECVSISLGLVTANQTDDLVTETLVQKADENLYRAKENGRNQVVGET